MGMDGECWQGWVAIQCKALVWEAVVWGLSAGSPTCSLCTCKWPVTSSVESAFLPYRESMERS